MKAANLVANSGNTIYGVGVITDFGILVIPGAVFFKLEPSNLVQLEC